MCGVSFGTRLSRIWVGRMLAVLLAVAAVCMVAGCQAILGVLFTYQPCNYGLCGESGQLLQSSRGAEDVCVMIEAGGCAPFIWSPHPVEGFAFAQTPKGLRLYVAGDGVMLDYDGVRSSVLGQTIPIPDCGPLGDVAVSEDGTVVVSCPETGRLARVDPASASVIESFQCCDDADGSFDPNAVAVTPEGAVLAGTSRISVFDGQTGRFLQVAVEEGVEGATSYDDFMYGPNGNLFVAANPDVGVLEFDGQTFEFVRVFVSVESGELFSPVTALAFSDNGNLVVGGGEPWGTIAVLEFNGETGALRQEISRCSGECWTTVAALAYRP